MSDTIEPTEAEREFFKDYADADFMTQAESYRLFVLRAHVTAEVAKATGELRALSDLWADCARNAYKVECEVRDGTWRAKAEIYQSCADQLKSAIDAARAQQKDTP